MLSSPSTSNARQSSRSLGRSESIMQPGPSSSNSVGQRLHNGYKALQVKAKSSWLDLRQRNKQSQAAEAEAAAAATTATTTGLAASNDLLVVQGDQRRGSGGTLKAGGRWIMRSSRPSSSGSTGSTGAQPFGSWGRRAAKAKDQYVAVPMGPSPSNTAHASPPAVEAQQQQQGGISSLASFAFPGSLSSSSSVQRAPNFPRRASEAPHCTCPTAVLRRHSELPADLPTSEEAEAKVASLSRATSRTSSTYAPPPRRRSRPRPSAVRAKLLAQLASWDFCSLDLSVEELQMACELLFETALTASLPTALLEATSSSHQRREAAQLGQTTTLAEHFGIPPDSIRRFIAGLAELYHSSNAYHNFHHAADVLQALYALLVDLHALPSLHVDGAETWDPECSPIAPMDALALLFAAIGHDAGHPGLSNAFLANASTPLATAFRCPASRHVDTQALGPIAQRMPEGSPLECYHSLLLEALIRRCGLNHLVWAHAGARSEMGDVIRSCVLATDMAIHAAFVTALENVEARMGSHSSSAAAAAAAAHKMRQERLESAQSLRRRERCERTLHCAALLKCADVSNPLRVRGIGRRWSVALRREWQRQSALEEECALPLTVGMARSNRCTHSVTQQQQHHHDQPLPSSSATDDEGLRRTSAAHMVARVGGGGGAAAEAAEISVAELKVAGELEEERALARGQVAFVRLFVTPLLTAMTRVLPELTRYATYAHDNELLWAERLAAVEALLCDSSSPEPDALSSPLCVALPHATLTALGAERLRVSLIFLPPEPSAAPLDTHTAQRLVHRVMEEALTQAMRTWSTAATTLPEGQPLAQPQSDVTWFQLEATSLAQRQDVKERLLEQQQQDTVLGDTTLTTPRLPSSRAPSTSTAHGRHSVSTTSFASSSVESLASSSPATAYSNASASTAATSSLLALHPTTSASTHGAGTKTVALPGFDDSGFVQAQRGSLSSPPVLVRGQASLLLPSTDLDDTSAGAAEGADPTTTQHVGLSPKSRRKSLGVVKRFSPWSPSGSGASSSTTAPGAGAEQR